jgi:Cu(I)/Ag(I) efflux system membrane protein CusA/SilA
MLTWALPRRNLVMWMFAVLLILAAGIFPLQALIGQGASEAGWKLMFLIVFAIVTSLTVISTRGRPQHRWWYFLVTWALVIVIGSLFACGLKLQSFTIPVPLIGGIALKWGFYAFAWSVAAALFYLGVRTDSVVIWRTISLVTLIWIGLIAYRFPKIGVAFMPALDEGTTLDMPITVPRASVTQSADDLKARDALLRGFPEVESVIGKAGRADTPTDPAPLDMVETFVNFRPREYWPKRVLRYADAERQARDVLNAMEKAGFVVPPKSPEDRQSLVNDAAQKALERCDETLRELALTRYQEFEGELGGTLVSFSVRETIGQMEKSGTWKWPDGIDRDKVIDELIASLSKEVGPWMAVTPALEDGALLVRRVAIKGEELGAVADIAHALELKSSVSGQVIDTIEAAFGRRKSTFSEILLQRVTNQHARLWHEHVRAVNWELFDRGVDAYTSYAIEEVARVAKQQGATESAAKGAETEALVEASLQSQWGDTPDSTAYAPLAAIKEQLLKPFADRVFLWPRQNGPKGDLVDDEMGRVLQVPGWSNIFTQPIINRIEMLSTGVRTDIGVKVFGPDLDTIDGVCKQIEAALKPVKGARDVIAAPIMGKGYLDIDIDREAAARYGISVEDIQNEIEVALAGRAVTYTVEKRERFPVRIRYARSSRESEESIRRLLVSPNAMGGSAPMPTESQSARQPGGGIGMLAANPNMSDGHSASPGHAISGRPLIPLSAVAEIKIVEGPAMIKSENGRLLNYVTLNVRKRDIVGFVDEARRVISEKVNLPEGVHIEWSGEFEHQVRLARTLLIVTPAVIAVIFLILYLTYKDLADAALMMLTVPEALAGGAFFMYIFPKIVQGWDAPPMDFSATVWVGFIACFGMATETGIIMLVYLREAIERRGGLEKIQSLEELRQAVIEGAVHRLRPKLLTEGVAIISIFPMVFANGVGGEILAPMALPVLGGLLISDEVVDLFLPVRFYWIRRARWLKLHGRVDTGHVTHSHPAEPVSPSFDSKGTP